MDRAKLNGYLADCIEPAYSPPFRGQIYDYARKLDLQSGYAVKGPFCIETLRQLVGPLEAIRNPYTRLISIRAAVQTCKSLVADICVPYWIEHDPGDVLWLLEDDAKAKIYAERCLNLVRSVPEIAGLLDDVDRHDKTKTALRFRHMKVVMAGLNPGNVQSLSWRYVIVDETWLHAWDGLIRQAMDRTKQFRDTCKILLLGQGGWENDDHDREHKGCLDLDLHYACPECGRYQTFELSRQRPDDFPIEKMRGTYGGLSWVTDDATRPNGKWNYEAVAKTAHHRCYYCDARIEDTPEVRRRLNDSYLHLPIGCDPVKPAAPTPARAMAFHWPAEASMRIPFGDLVIKYLRAKVSAEEQGYRLPLQEYYQKDRGLAWNDLLEGEFRVLTREEYDVKADWSEEAFRVLMVDCQRDLKKFYATAFALSRSGESRELERSEPASFAEIEAMQKRWNIPHQRVFLDCGYRMTEVLRACVQHGHQGTLKVGAGMRKIWLCWTGLKGSGQELFRHENPKTGTVEHRIYSARKFYDVSVGTSLRLPRAPWYEWSNLHCKDLLRARRDQDPGVPKFLTLPDTLPSTDQNSYFAQMRSEKRAELYRGGRKINIWLPVAETRPNHRWDIGAMLMAVEAIMGIIGSDQVETQGEASEKAMTPEAG